MNPAAPAASSPTWSSRLVFILATIGFSVGMGNIWRFPYLAGENGGSAFVLVYLTCVLVIGVPLVTAEMLLGRRGRGSPVTAMRNLVARGGFSRGWIALGWLALATVFVIMGFYSVVAGWTLDYAWQAAAGSFAGFDAAASGQRFGSVLENPLRLAASQAAFLLVTLWIVARGLAAGIERAINWLMPALFGLLLVLVGYALVVGDAARGLAFLFTPDFSGINGRVVLAAVGQAFFSIGIGMAALISYGSYLQPEVSIPRSALIVVFADTLVAVVAGIAMFPLVFAFGLSPGEGPGLVFQILPVAFGAMPFGQLFGTLFFVLLFVAALTSSIAIVEPVVGFGVEHGWSRRAIIVAYGIALWLTGLLAVLSFNWLSGFHPLGFLELFSSHTLFDLMDFATSNLMLTGGGLLIALFVGWRLPAAESASELRLGTDHAGFRLWRFLLRWVCPPAIALVLVFGLAG